MRTIVVLVVLVALTGCGPPPPEAMPLWDPQGEGLFDAPWPSDGRVRDDGTIDMSGFPGADDAGLLGRYLQLANQQTGFGTNSPVYVRFDQPLDRGRLPSPEGSLARGASLLLVDVDPGSEHWGERVPVQWQLQEARTTYQPANLLAVAPVWGFPLRPTTKYALVVTTDLARRHPDFAQVWRRDHPDHALYADLEAALLFQGLSPEKVAVATVFTTADPLADMRAITRFVHRMQTPTLSQTLGRLPDEDTLFYDVHLGRYQGPLFQHGDRPYATRGGEFRFDADGVPQIHSWDDMRMAVCTPKDLSQPPPGGWPVVMYAHGTGGDFRSFCRGKSGIATASLFARSGMIGIGIDQPLHGTRATPATDPDLHWFNYLNPDSGRTNFRQAAIDTVYLGHALGSGQVVLRTEEGQEVPLDPDRVMFMGHSQGGISGAIALPFVGDDVRAAVLSGAGAGLAITVVQRKDPTDIALQLSTILGFAPDEQVTELHPVLGLVQWLVEVTDPVNYAPYYFAEDGGLPGGAPVSVLLMSGQHDAQTPHSTATTLAAAARLPLLDPSFDASEGLRLRQLTGARAPLELNAIAWDGNPVTAGLSQWADGDHWVVFDDADAAVMTQTFLATAAEDAPRIEIRR